MSCEGLKECIPPAYTEYLGRVMLGVLANDQTLPTEGAAKDS